MRARARSSSLAPNAHALQSRLFVRSLARIRTCTHLDQWPADHPARKTSRDAPRKSISRALPSTDRMSGEPVDRSQMCPSRVRYSSSSVFPE